jgi:hypothetical protein
MADLHPIGTSKPDPTPAQLAERIRDVQATWSPEEKLRRRAVQMPWTVPTYEESVLQDAPGIAQRALDDI